MEGARDTVEVADAGSPDSRADKRNTIWVTPGPHGGHAGGVTGAARLRDGGMATSP